MKIPKFIPLFLVSCIATLPVVASAAMVPDGTTLVVKTASTISSRDTAGKPFKGQLLQDVQVKGKVVLAAATPVAGVVESPQVRAGSSARPLSLKLTQVSVGGRMVPVKTESFTTKDAGVKGQHVTRVTAEPFFSHRERPFSFASASLLVSKVNYGDFGFGQPPETEKS